MHFTRIEWITIPAREISDLLVSRYHIARFESIRYTSRIGHTETHLLPNLRICGRYTKKKQSVTRSYLLPEIDQSVVWYNPSRR